VNLTVNGKPVELPAPTPLLDYLAGLGVNPRAVAVEINERILERAEFDSAQLREGDVVEVVRMVGGGSRITSGSNGSRPRPRPARPRARGRPR